MPPAPPPPTARAPLLGESELTSFYWPGKREMLDLDEMDSTTTSIKDWIAGQQAAGNKSQRYAIHQELPPDMLAELWLPDVAVSLDFGWDFDRFPSLARDPHRPRDGSCMDEDPCTVDESCTFGVL